MNGVFHQNFAAGAYAVHLFISAIAGAKPGRHDNKSCLHICFPPHIPDPVFRCRVPTVQFIIPHFFRRFNRFTV